MYEAVTVCLPTLGKFRFIVETNPFNLLVIAGAPAMQANRLFL